MKTPDAEIMLRQIPLEWHCIALDAENKEHDAVIMSDEITRNFGSFGIVSRDYGDSLYVAIKDFITPQGKITYRRNGEVITRRIESTSENPYFILITLGEEC